MKASKRKISMRERIKTLEITVNSMMVGTINSLVRAVSVLGSTFEEYVCFGENRRRKYTTEVILYEYDLNH